VRGLTFGWSWACISLRPPAARLVSGDGAAGEGRVAVMATVAVRESVTLAGRAERARAARSFVFPVSQRVEVPPRTAASARNPPGHGLYVQSPVFRRYTAETRRNYVTDIALLLTFLWGPGAGRGLTRWSPRSGSTR
jgi:hypothetical protein